MGRQSPRQPARLAQPVAMTPRPLSPEEALLLLNDHLGEHVELQLASTAPEAGTVSHAGVLRKLTVKGAGQSELCELLAGLYRVGDATLSIGGLERARAWEVGVGWELAEGVVLSAEWRTAHGA